MATIDVMSLGAEMSVDRLWPALARRALDWLSARHLPVRDAVVLLPYAALLPIARAAFAELGGWQPRVETLQTLAASLAAPQAPVAGQISGDAVVDRMLARTLLLKQPWAAALRLRDGRDFDALVASMVDFAQALTHAAACHAPKERNAYWSHARVALFASAPADAFENALALTALEWAMQGGSQNCTQSTDVVFTLRPSAWIALRMGGADALTDGLLAHAQGAALMFDADPSADDPFTAQVQVPGFVMPQRWLCDDLEREAHAAAATVIEAVDAGRTPVALVALDRLLVRRVRALLQRESLVISDETGWRLSTTPAAAQVMSLLRAAAPAANDDDRLDWLKCAVTTNASGDWRVTLEAHWRDRDARSSGDALRTALQAWTHEAKRLALLSEPRGEQSLQHWLARLHEAWRGEPSRAAASLAADTSTHAVVNALRIGTLDADWLALAHAQRMDLAGFTDWVAATLEATNFEPATRSDADVVLTPLARAVGRPFALIVVPGADASRLGAQRQTHAHMLVSQALAERLGIAHPGTHLLRQRLAFAQLLRAKRLTLTRRRLDGGDPLAPSSLVQWLSAVVGQHRPAADAAELPWQPQQRPCARTPVPRPLPQAAEALPEQLSATTVSALRECPYRFYARAVLRLAPADEIDVPLSKRDYGTWLHEVLFHFHRQRTATSPQDLETLMAAAQQTTERLHIDAADLLPFQTSFEAFAPAYLAWLGERERLGWTWHAGEEKHEARPAELAPQRMHGRLDRIDHGPRGAIELIDYKTGNFAELNSRVKTPLENTQLVFYAALLRDEIAPGTPLTAMYLALDDKEAPKAAVDANVLSSVDAMLAGLGQDFAALRGGAAMPALGERKVCETCDARGLCRRDHWGAAPTPIAGPDPDPVAAAVAAPTPPARSASPAA